jgi:putative transposase
MTRPLRIEFAGALYHITARGNAQGDIYTYDEERQKYLTLLANACERFDWYCHAYCQMSNHYHLLIETNSPTLSKGMKYLNGTYTQYFNRRNRRVGHVFQGRYKAILVQKENYLLELSRYIVLNPVRARMVREAVDWPWSSYRATAGFKQEAPWLTTAWLLSGFATNRKEAQDRYRLFIQQGKNQASPWEQLKNQIYPGTDQFVKDMQCKIDPSKSLEDIPRKQKQSPPRPLSYYANRYAVRDEAMAYAYLSGHDTLTVVGNWFGVSNATVSRAVKAVECKM